MLTSEPPLDKTRLLLKQCVFGTDLRDGNAEIAGQQRLKKIFLQNAKAGMLHLEGALRMVRRDLRISKQAITDEQLSHLFSCVDPSGCGVVAYPDFVAYLFASDSGAKEVAMQQMVLHTRRTLSVAVRRSKLSVPKFRELFKKFDPQGAPDGTLRPLDMRTFLRGCLRLTTHECPDRYLTAICCMHASKSLCGCVAFEDILSFIAEQEEDTSLGFGNSHSAVPPPPRSSLQRSHSEHAARDGTATFRSLGRDAPLFTHTGAVSRPTSATRPLSASSSSARLAIQRRRQPLSAACCSSTSSLGTSLNEDGALRPQYAGLRRSHSVPLTRPQSAASKHASLASDGDALLRKRPASAGLNGNADKRIIGSAKGRECVSIEGDEVLERLQRQLREAGVEVSCRRRPQVKGTHNLHALKEEMARERKKSWNLMRRIIVSEMQA